MVWRRIPPHRPAGLSGARVQCAERAARNWSSASERSSTHSAPMESLGAKMKRTSLVPRWWKRRFTAVITETDPSCKVVYLGNVLTGWAKGDWLSLNRLAQRSNESNVALERASFIVHRFLIR